MLASSSLPRAPHPCPNLSKWQEQVSALCKTRLLVIVSGKVAEDHIHKCRQPSVSCLQKTPPFISCQVKKDKICQQIFLCDLSNLFSISGFHFHLSDWLPAWHDYYSPTTLRVLSYLFLHLCVLPHSDPAAPLFGWKWYASSIFLFGWKWYASSTLQPTRNDHFLDVSPHQSKNRIWWSLFVCVINFQYFSSWVYVFRLDLNPQFATVQCWRESL